MMLLPALVVVGLAAFFRFLEFAADAGGSGVAEPVRGGLKSRAIMRESEERIGSKYIQPNRC